MGDRLLLHNTLVGGSTSTTGILGFSLQALISHRFRPTDHAPVFHRDLIRVVQVLSIAMAVLVVGLTALLLRSGPSSVASRPGVPAGAVPVEATV